MPRTEPAPPAQAAGAVHEALIELYGFALRHAESHERLQHLQALIERATNELVELDQRVDIAEAAYTLLELQYAGGKIEAPAADSTADASSPNALERAGDSLAESEGFEPPNGFPSPDFESVVTALTRTRPDANIPGKGHSSIGDDSTAPRHDERACRSCGCTDGNACLVREEGEVRACRWTAVDPQLCDACLFPGSRVRSCVAAADLVRL